MKGEKEIRQHYFIARELQASIVILVVVALLGGTFLLYLSKALNNILGIKTQTLTIILILGYTAIVAFCAIFFTHRLVGPFKRLEYEMKLIAKGDISRRLSIRSNDDWHIRSFVTSVNTLIERFEEKSLEYKRLNNTLSKKLSMMKKKAEKDESLKDLVSLIETIHKEIHELGEKW